MGSQDFQITIGARGEHGYPVSLAAADGSEAASTMALPPEVELRALVERVPDAVLASSARARRVATRRDTPVQRLGQTLFDALLTGEARTLFAVSRHQAGRQEHRLRVVLRVHAPELAALPWEFLYDPSAGDYLCLTTPLIRHPQVPRPVRPLRVRPPLRVLCQVAHPDDQQGLDTEDERRRMRTALAGLESRGLVRLAFTDGPSWRALRDALREPWHVLHFIGHGGFDAGAQQGTLALVDEADGGTYALSADLLASMLAAQPALRLVVLNACETGRSSPSDPFSSTAGTLMRGGASAVLSMQYPISDHAAITFSGSLYDALANGRPVDEAITEARLAIPLAQPGSLEWGTPVLHMRSPDGRLFDVERDTAVPGEVAVKPEPETEPKPRAEPEPEPDLEPNPGGAEEWPGLSATASTPPASPSPSPSSPPSPPPPAAAWPLSSTGAEEGPERLRIKHLRTLRTPDSASTVEFSPDGKHLAIAGTKVVVLTDLHGRRVMRVRSRWLGIGHDEGTLAFSPNGRNIAVSFGYGCVIRSLTSSTRLLRIDQGRRPAFSPDGARIALVTGSTVRVWDTDTGALITAVGADRKTNSALFTPDGRRLITACDDGALRLWELHNGNEVGELSVGDNAFRLVLSPDATRLATKAILPPTEDDKGYVRQQAVVLDTSTGTPLFTLGFQVTGVAFSPDVRAIATSSFDQTVRIWDLGTGEELHRISHVSSTYDVAISPDGKLLAIANGGRRIELWRLTWDGEEQSEEGDLYEIW
ncbi:CHAT domain-containing WD40 repeat protein [Streptomyces sp. 4N509B]|uniref:CHAT domain-containing WD40 repeat protein n=1 Tax=Streptomyces sp. 4N509B TaxID=3457413 RepID=UPI003FD6225C